jgi:hypothetical protein
LLLCLASSVVFAQETVIWPAGLEAVATGELARLREAQERIRLATIQAPQGIELTQQYDRANHACHTGPAQSFREFDSPRVRGALEGGRIPVRYPYRLRYRKAATLPELFAKGWSEGTGGQVEIVFGRVGDSWERQSSREVFEPATGRSGRPLPTPAAP